MESAGEGQEARPGEGGNLQVKMVAGKMRRGAAWPWKLVSYLVVGDVVVVVVSLLSPSRPHLPGREEKGMAGREGGRQVGREGEGRTPLGQFSHVPKEV